MTTKQTNETTADAGLTSRRFGKVTALGHQYESCSRDHLVSLLNQAKNGEIGPAMSEVELAAILSKFDEETRAYNVKKEACGLDAAEQRCHELSDARCDAEDAVLCAQPRTHAGVFALLTFTAEYLADDMGTNMCKVVPVFVNAARSMRAIAGDTAPLTISKELAEVLSGDRV